MGIYTDWSIDLDNGIVGWESQDDPAMPLNFPESRKWFLIALLASITFISPLASSMFAPAVSFMDTTFHNSSLLLSSLSVSIFVLGYVIGPLILAPMSEIYGRRYVLTGANIFFCVWQIGAALSPSLSALIVFRFLAGIGGSGCLTIGGGVIADLFHPDRRGLASSVYSLGPLFGPVIGPICGGCTFNFHLFDYCFFLSGLQNRDLSPEPRLVSERTRPFIAMSGLL